ncbi:MAG: protease HtpX [Succinatimonas sp.]|nr:protease HtpX [Succinatimonas sp.]
MKRILLFVAMQLAVLLVVSIVGSIIMNLFGIRLSGGSYTGILIMCAIYGCVGSMISLFMSKTMCKTAYGVQIITNPSTYQERFIYNTVAEFASRSGFKMPEVGIYQSPDPNAFATGASKDNALVAVSTGLLDSMTEEEVRGVIGHEISHIQNGDMVTMTLLQGVLNTFVYFFSYIVSQFVVQAMNNRDDEEGGSSGNFMMFYLINSIMQIIFGIGATLILMWFSRYREYRADAGSAMLSGRSTMIHALQALQRGVQPQSSQRASMQALCINSADLASLFSSHPPLEKRIAALQNLNM